MQEAERTEVILGAQGAVTIGPVEELLRRAAVRNCGGRCRGKLACDKFGGTRPTMGASAASWSMVGALLCEAGLNHLPGIDTLVEKLGKPIEILMGEWPELRYAVDLRLWSATQLLDIIHDIITDDALVAWWGRAIANAKEQGL